MSPQGIGITTTYKTRVAPLKPCKERYGTLIGQLTDSPTSGDICCRVRSEAVRLRSGCPGHCKSSD